jgi:hypothetical protein
VPGGGTLALSGTSTSANKRIYFTGRAATGGQGDICIKINNVVCKMYIKVYHDEPSFQCDLHGIITNSTDMSTATNI